MNQQKQIEAAAELDGYEKRMRGDQMCCWWKDGRMYKLPDYLHDHNAIQRLVDGMGSPENFSSDYHKFLHELDQMMYTLHYDVAIDEVFISTDYYLQATCAQKLESILKACGVWGEG